MAKTTVSAGYIAANAITATELAANSVTAASISAGAILSVDVGANSVTSTAIAANAVSSSEVASNAISTAQIASNAVTAASIATNAVGADQISPNAVESSEIASNAVGTAQIAGNSVGISELNVSDGTNGQYLQTNGSGTLSFSTVSGYTDSDVETYLDGGTSTPTFSSATVSGDLTVDTSTLYVDATNNFVGIGTTSEYTGTTANLTVADGIDVGVNDATGGTLFFTRNAAVGSIGSVGGKWTGYSTGPYINFYADNVSGGSQAGSIHFYTTHSNSSTEKMVLTSDGKVGIGTTSPSSYYSKSLVVSAGNEDGITIVAANGATTYANYLMFADGTTGNERYRGWLGYDHNTDSFNIASHGFLRIYSGSTTQERIRITSSGDVGIGTDNPSAKVDISVGAGNYIHKLTNADEGEFALRTYNHGSSTTGAAVFTQGLYYSTTENAAVRYHRGGGGSDGFLSFSAAGGERVRILGTGGITFNGDTAAANALDDYEEGTWTATLPQGGNAIYQGNSYTKIGRLVTVYCQFRGYSTPNNSNTFQVGNLPFAAAAGSQYGSVSCARGFPSVAKSIVAYATGSVFQFRAVPHNSSGGGLGDLLNSNLTGYTNDFDISFAVTYMTS